MSDGDEPSADRRREVPNFVYQAFLESFLRREPNLIHAASAEEGITDLGVLTQDVLGSLLIGKG